MSYKITNLFLENMQIINGRSRRGGSEMGKIWTLFLRGKKSKNLADRFLTPPETLHIVSLGVASALAEGVS